MSTFPRTTIGATESIKGGNLTVKLLPTTIGDAKR